MKPVELIVTNTLYEALAKMNALPTEFRAPITDALCSMDGAEHVARAILAKIAHNASVSVVFKAIAAVGGPTTKTEIVQRITAARDHQAAHAD